MDEKNWISVKDGLPKKDGDYLCTVKGLYGYSSIQILSFANKLSKADEFEFFGINRAGWYDYDSEAGNYEVGTVVAWMELPKPYKEEEE